MGEIEAAKILFSQGLGHLLDGQYERAEREFRESLERVPGRVSTLTNLSVVLIRLKKYDEAQRILDDILARDPTVAQAWLNFGLIAQEKLSDYPKALEYFDRALAIDPGYPEAWLNKGVVLAELKRQDAAVEAFNRAIALNPGYADAYGCLGDAYLRQRQHQTAIENFDKALALKPGLAYVAGSRLHAKMHICDWHSLQAELSELARMIERGEKCATPFAALAFVDAPALQRRTAEVWANDERVAALPLPPIPPRPRSAKIRLGYFSADFRAHPVAFQTAGLFEAHDRSRFELTAFAFGPDANDTMSRRIEAAFDRFIDVRAQSDRGVALLARNLGIDIAVDLGGLTQDARTEIFALRAAPLQVSFLGYPGTMGADYMDYLVADRIVIPDARRPHYREKIACLPHCYLVNDRRRAVPKGTFPRRDMGLPPAGFVFCCFNGSYKITPEAFDSWMRILGRVDGSVLWLSNANPAAVVNLRREAEARGINAPRIKFADRMPRMEDYLARLRVADLFIDTLPYNAHSTASDALWAGVPVLTCMGEAFAGRVAASLLHAVGLPELVTTTREQFEALAVELATNPQRLEQIRLKLERNRLTTPLFDTGLFARHLEDAYTQMYERYQANLAPDHIHVKA